MVEYFGNCGIAPGQLAYLLENVVQTRLVERERIACRTALVFGLLIRFSCQHSRLVKLWWQS